MMVRDEPTESESSVSCVCGYCSSSISVVIGVQPTLIESVTTYSNTEVLLCSCKPTSAILKTLIHVCTVIPIRLYVKRELSFVIYEHSCKPMFLKRNLAARGQCSFQGESIRSRRLFQIDNVLYHTGLSSFLSTIPAPRRGSNCSHRNQHYRQLWTNVYASASFEVKTAATLPVSCTQTSLSA